MKRKLLLISHCFLNDAVKLKHQDRNLEQKERHTKRLFLKKLLDANIELIQLPCPEFLLYGSNRWGHASSQFDTPFFRKEVRLMLEPFLLQIEEYHAHPEAFELLGIVGIDGSPSCGIHFTYDGDWGGELSSRNDLSSIASTLQKVDSPGIFMDTFSKMLKERNITIPFYSIETFLQKMI